MKTTRAGIVLAALLILFAGISQAKNGPSKPVQDCRDKNQKALSAVEAQYKGARLVQADQDRYKSMHAAIVAPNPGGGSLEACRARGGKIEELRTALAGMIAHAALPVYKVGDRALGGVVFHVTDGGRHGLVADVQDIDTRWRRIHFDAAVDACNRSTAGGQSDWFLPDSGQLALLWEQRTVVGNFQTSGYDHYWSSSRMQGDRYQQAKVYWRQFSNGQTGWSDTTDNGPNRPLFNARAIRKF